MEDRVLFNVYTVTTTADDGPGSLRQAITRANTSGGADVIQFAIPGPGVHSIAPLSPLPEVTGPTTIDGTTQPGALDAAYPLVEIDGSGAGPAADGLTFAAASGPNTVRGLVINRFGRHGIVTAAQGLTRIEKNYIGTDPTGQNDLGNGGSGVVVQGQGLLILGGLHNATSNAGNVISGNEFAGVWVNAAGSPTLDIEANYIGTDAFGTRAIGNGREGILVDGGLVKIGRGNSGDITTGNVISGNGSSGIRLNGAAASNTLVEGNFIGTDATGSRALPNGASPVVPYHDGVTVLAANNVWIGNTDAGSRNVISGNIGAGVSVRGGQAGHGLLTGNYIGTDATGNARLGNGGDGVFIAGVSMLPGITGNVVSGNGGDGVHVEGTSFPAPTVTIDRNRIGTNATGTGALGNEGDGVDLEGALNGMLGGAGSTSKNLISANGGSGVRLANAVSRTGVASLTVRVQGNYIGTDLSGNARLGNGADGITVDQVTLGAPIAGNLLSGNDGDGIRVSASDGFRIRELAIGGNYIGTNAAGNGPLGNGANGIELAESFGFYIGGAPQGTTVPAVINPGGTGRNIISANAGHGILITDGIGATASGERGIIRYNYIGTDVTGTSGLGNGGSGVYATVGGSRIGETPGGTGPNTTGNVISANAGDGVTIVGAPTGNAVVANKIGTNAAGSDSVASLGNRGHGVAIYDSSNNLVGGAGVVRAGNGNMIAFNGRSGVAVEGTAGTSSTPGAAEGNTIAGNAIFSNGGLGIDLVYGNEGVTPNDPRDPDGGPNGLQNFPVLSRVASAPGVTNVRYSLNSVPSRNYRLDFYASPAPDPSGFGEGKTYLGSVTVSTDANGDASGATNLTTTTTLGTYVTATATMLPVGTTPSGGTSEFSRPAQVVAPGPGTIEGRFVFYNGSAFDQGTTLPSPDDDAAIAPDKQALLPGAGPATFANYTSYPKGINGLMVDIAGLPINAAPTAADFAFRVGRAAADGSVAWSDGPAPATINLRRGEGVGGSDRVTLIWFSYDPSDDPAVPQAVRDGWLEVTVRNTARTNLARPDVFYFGNLAGETGDAIPGASAARVTAADLAGVKRALNSTRGITNRFDLNRDGVVNALDLAVARANLLHSLPLPLPVSPAPAAAPAADTALPPPIAPVSTDTTDRDQGAWSQVAT